MSNLAEKETKAERMAKFSAQQIEGLAKLLKIDLLNISEAAFKEYAKKRGCNNGMVNTEWTRYKRILNKYLG